MNAPRHIILEPGRAEKNYWQDLWRYRELFEVLARRDISVRYKQTLMGVAWAVIRPFLTMVVFTVIFGKVAKLPSEGNAPGRVCVVPGIPGPGGEGGGAEGGGDAGSWCENGGWLRLRFMVRGRVGLRAAAAPGMRAVAKRGVHKWKGWVRFRTNPEVV